MSVRDHVAADRYAMNLPVCPRCFSYATGDEPDCGECGYRLYPRNIDRPRPLSTPVDRAAGAKEDEA